MMMRQLTAIGAAALLSAAGIACTDQGQQQPVEEQPSQTQDDLGEAGEEAGQKVGEAGEQAGEAGEEAGEDIQDQF